MTEEDLKKRVDDLEDKVERLRAVILTLLDQERKASLSEARRLHNIIRNDEQYALICEDLAASIT